MKLKFITENDDLIPEYGTSGSAGFDVKAAESCVIEPGEAKAVKTGLRFELPQGYAILSCSRSGNAMKKGIISAIGPGVIDSDYRGECFACVRNVSKEPKEIKRGDRIAQFVIVPFATASFERVEELDETERGASGFGSTGGM